MPVRPPLPSAADVARLAGVSRSAVSRSFTDGASVSDATRAKVMAAAAQLNYHVNHLARGISKEESRPVCLLGADLSAPFQACLLEAITRRLQEAGRMAMVINAGSDPASAREALQSTLQYRASATIVLSGTPPADLVRLCIGAGQRVILINRDDALEDVHHIRIDYRTAMRDGARMMQRAGCRRVTVVNSASGTASLMQRERMFLEEMHLLGLEAQVWRGGSTSYATGQRAAREVLAGATRPDGVFCINDLIALGFLGSARQDFRLRVPQDLCLLGFDDIPQAGWQGHDLTTFAQPFDEIAAVILRNLRQTGASCTMLPAAPVWRGTIRPFMDNNAEDCIP
ncbi:substrate-binding domain-containing protein [Falsirhodobacter deserti]|uniref:LacI family DNA-binding transcriptional regulator n=1 Tax=Falsirhodobacter deserti TaxID=1365611 RepID=UPI000FE41882|nr:substrate-binding domain-containing protein [Falsirhodobacter deserti]